MNNICEVKRESDRSSHIADNMQTDTIQHITLIKLLSLPNELFF